MLYTLQAGFVEAGERERRSEAAGVWPVCRAVRSLTHPLRSRGAEESTGVQSDDGAKTALINLGYFWVCYT
jgi:hypothetical protein